MTQSDDLNEILAVLDVSIQRFAIRIMPREWQDVAQEMRLAVITSHGRYEKGHDLPCVLWCWRRAKGAGIDYLRAQIGDRRCKTPHPDLISLAEVEWRNAFANDDPGLEQAEQRIDLVALAGSCTPLQRQVLGLMLSGMNAAEAARERGRSDASVTHLLHHVRQRAYDMGIRERPVA